MFGVIRWRLVGWSVLVLGTSLLVLGSILYVSLSRSLMEAVDANLLTSSQAAQAGLQETAEPGTLERDGYQGGLFFVVIEGTGRVVANSQQTDTRIFSLDLASTLESGGLTPDTPDGETRIYARAVQQRALGTVTLIVGQSPVTERMEEARLLLVIALGGGLGLALSFAAAWFLAERALVPIRSALERQQEFVADASHELRTPLTILHSATDLLHQRFDEPLRVNVELVDQLTQEIARMERLTRDLLTLPLAEQYPASLEVGASESMTSV